MPRDFDRPLNKRGEKAAVTMGTWVKRNGLVFDHVVASPAVRVIDTIDQFVKGVGGRMDTLQCAVVLAKLERFDWEIERRLALGDRYGRLIRDSGAPVQLLAVRPDRNCVWAQYTVMVDDRPAVQEAAHGVGQGLKAVGNGPS